MIKTQFIGVVTLISETRKTQFGEIVTLISDKISKTMFENLLRIVCGERVPSTPHNREEDDAIQNSIIEVAPHVIAREATVSSSNDDPELLILTENYGDLVEGRVIKISLQELLRLIPRTRRRSDAYKALKTKLQRIGVTLHITSNRKGGGKDEV